MQYFIGGLVGVVATLAFVSLVSKRGLADLNGELVSYWKISISQKADENTYLATIADAAETWKGKYTRMKSKAEAVKAAADARAAMEKIQAEGQKKGAE